MEIGVTSSCNNNIILENYQANIQTKTKEEGVDCCTFESSSETQGIYYENYEKVQNKELQVSSNFGKEVLFKTIGEAFPYTESNVFIAEDYGERQVCINDDKINYLAQQLLKQGVFDNYKFKEIYKKLEEVYPFKGDSIWMKKSVLTGAVVEAGCYYAHNKLKDAFEDAGVTAATLSIDAKGEITVEAADGGDLEKLKQTLTHKSDLFQTVYCKGVGTTVMPDSPEEKRFLVTEVRWMLWKKYGLKIDDLIDENGQVKELPESMRETKDAEKYFSDLILYGWKHGMTEDTLLGKLTYVNGKLYVR